MDSFKESLISYLMMNGRLTTREIYALFPEMNKQTVSWHLNQELMKGNIRKAGHGVYEIGTHIPEKEERQQNIPELSKDVYTFEYFPCPATPHPTLNLTEPQTSQRNKQVQE